MAGEYLEKQELPILRTNNREMNMKYRWFEDDREAELLDYYAEILHEDVY